MRRAAEAEEPLLGRIGIQPQRLDPRQPGRREPGDDIGLEIELVMVGAGIREEAFVFGIGLAEAAEEAGVDLVAGARDARAEIGRASCRERV